MGVGRRSGTGWAVRGLAAGTVSGAAGAAATASEKTHAQNAPLAPANFFRGECGNRLDVETTRSWRPAVVPDRLPAAARLRV